MRLNHVIWLVLLLAALLISPAYAAQSKTAVHVRADINLGNYDVVIGDMGGRYTSWNDSPTRIRAEVLDRSRTREYYFDNLPAALFVLRLMYGEPEMVQLDVLDYAGLGLIDSRQAYYIWDYEQQSRGGLPLVLAFGSYRAAQDESRYRDSRVLDYDGVVRLLNRWEETQRDQIYWRGWDQDSWNTQRWNSAWDSRWQGWDWDDKRGWSKTVVAADSLSKDPFSRRSNRGKGDIARQDQEKRDRDRENNGKGDRARGKDREKNKDKDPEGKDNRDDDGKGKGGNNNGKGRSK